MPKDRMAKNKYATSLYSSLFLPIYFRKSSTEISTKYQTETQKIIIISGR